jgi:hypothetical protein
MVKQLLLTAAALSREFGTAHDGAPELVATRTA